MTYHSTGVANKGRRKGKIKRSAAKAAPATSVKVRDTITIQVPNVCYRYGYVSARTVEAQVIHLDHKGNYAVVEYCVPGQKTPLTTTISLRPIVRYDSNGHKQLSLARRGNGRSSKIGGPLNSSCPTPFGQDMTSHAR